VVAVIVEAEVQWVAGELFFQARIARIQRKTDDGIRDGTIPGRHDVLARGRKIVQRIGVAMAVVAKITRAIGWHTCFHVMLAQTGSPSRARGRQDTVGIVETAMTPHAGNVVDIVLSVAGAAEVYRSTGCSSAVVTGATAAKTQIIHVGIVETGSPGMALSRRRVAAVIPEAGVALGALSLVVRSV